MEARRDLDHGKALDLIVHLQAIEAIKRHAALGTLAHLSHILLHLAQRIELAAEHLVAVIACRPVKAGHLFADLCAAVIDELDDDQAD